MRSLLDLSKCAFAFCFADNEATNMLALWILLLFMCWLLSVFSFLCFFLRFFLIWSITIIIFEWNLDCFLAININVLIGCWRMIILFVLLICWVVCRLGLLLLAALGRHTAVLEEHLGVLTSSILKQVNKIVFDRVNYQTCRTTFDTFLKFSMR